MNLEERKQQLVEIKLCKKGLKTDDNFAQCPTKRSYSNYPHHSILCYDNSNSNSNSNVKANPNQNQS